MFDRKHLRMCRQLWSARAAVIAEGAALGFFAMLAMPGAATAAGPTQPFQYGLWQGGAYTNDQTGAFSHCVAAAHYQSGINMAVVVNRNFVWSLGFWNPQWSLTRGATIPIEMRFDGGAPMRVNGTVIGNAPTLLVEVPMPANSQLVTTFRKASMMQAIAQGQSFSFRLDGTSQILPMVANCVKSGLSAEAPAPSKSVVASAPEPTPAATAELQLQEMQLATNFLLATRLSNARVVNRSEATPQLASIGTVWKADSAVGAVKIYQAKGEQTGLDLASELIAGDAKSCRGKFASARSSELVDADVIYRAYTSCGDAQGERTLQYFISPWHKTNFAIFVVLQSDGAQEQSADTQAKEDLFKKAALSAAR